MAGGPERERKGRGEAPRTDLEPERDPYYEGYFGTDEEEGVVRERGDEEGAGREHGDAAARRTDREEADERKRRLAEDCAGGDREIG